MKKITKYKCDFCEYETSDYNQMLKHEKNKHSEKIYAIHIQINTLGRGESLGIFELYDKIFVIKEDFALSTKNNNNLQDFLDNVLFYEDWDEDFKNARIFDDIKSSDWFYSNVENNDDNANIVNISTFRFVYRNYNIMGNVSIIKCNKEIIQQHKNIYYLTKDYVKNI